VASLGQVSPPEKNIFAKRSEIQLTPFPKKSPTIKDQGE